MADTITRLLDRLPDREAPRRLLHRLETERPDEFVRLTRASSPQKLASLANLLTLAAYSPWLGDVLFIQPELIGWLTRKKGLERGATREDLVEELGRFAARHSGDDTQAILTAFKRQEMARIYLRDCLRIATLSETTEELSHLADAILARALTHARQQLANRYGQPHTTDERGRLVEAAFVVVSLGKLGSRELNYASDIDLMFLYSGAGKTSSTGRLATIEAIDNHAFFAKLAETLFKLVGTHVTTAPVYRVDLRLRPYGRDGEIAVSIDRAVDYYRTKARPWERQMLIRARASAGSESLVTRLLTDLRDDIFQPQPIPDAIRSVREARDEIEKKERSRGGGFNVKLGPGGIREIEFVTQALQLAYGGSDPWIRAPQVLIGLQRLADKGFLSDVDRATLSEAYTFFRTVEHRLQMAQGAQTHRLPLETEALDVLARRCGVDGAEPGAELKSQIADRAARVRVIAERVFATADRVVEPTLVALAPERSPTSEARFGADSEAALRPMESAAVQLASLSPTEGGDSGEDRAALRATLVDIASRLPSPARALRGLDRFLASLATSEEAGAAARALGGGPERLDQIVRLLGSGEFFGEILVAQPLLAAEIPGTLFCTVPRSRAEFDDAIGTAVRAETTTAGRMAALRRAWYRQIVAVGAHDVLGQSSLATVNREQSDLAEASLLNAVRIALGELTDDDELEPRMTLFGLGRLGHAGMDYGSDLDLIVVFDGEMPSPNPSLDPSTFYVRFSQTLVKVLSALTREGYVYRVDFRLRPEGAVGRLASSLHRMLEYIDGRASPWELTAYLKVRPVAGDPAFGVEARDQVVAAVFDAASKRDGLREALRANRLELEHLHGRVGRNIKWGRGGMMDVYYVTRHAQLRTRTFFPPERGTTALIEHLGSIGAIDGASARDLGHAYALLRRIDHEMRLLGDRNASRLPDERPLLEEIAKATGFSNVGHLEGTVAAAMEAIRAAFEREF